MMIIIMIIITVAVIPKVNSNLRNKRKPNPEPQNSCCTRSSTTPERPKAAPRFAEPPSLSSIGPAAFMARRHRDFAALRNYGVGGLVAGLEAHNPLSSLSAQNAVQTSPTAGFQQREGIIPSVSVWRRASICIAVKLCAPLQVRVAWPKWRSLTGLRMCLLLSITRRCGAQAEGGFCCC